MYIRRTQTRNSATGEAYYTQRLVQSVRVGSQVRQTTLLNLGRHFALAQEEWPALCARLEELQAGGQGALLGRVGSMQDETDGPNVCLPAGWRGSQWSPPRPAPPARPMCRRWTSTRWR